MKRAFLAAAIGVMLAVPPGAGVLAHEHGARAPGGEVMRDLAAGQPLGTGTLAEVGQSRQEIQSDRQRQIQPRSRIKPDGGPQEFSCRGGTCRCEGLRDCVDMAESGVCKGRMTCRRDVDACECVYEGIDRPRRY